MNNIIPVVSFVIVLFLPGHSQVRAEQSVEETITVYTQVDSIDIKDEGSGPRYSIPIKIEGSVGLKLAFRARATGGISSIRLNMFDTVSGDNTTPKAYADVDEKWRPILYRVDQFRYNSSLQKTVQAKASFSGIQFHGKRTPENKGMLHLENFVIYRGDDGEAPTPPSDLNARSTQQGIHLTWSPAIDKVGIARYVVSRAIQKEPFMKIAESTSLDFIDHPPATGNLAYRVLAVDFENNMSAWSNPISVDSPQKFPEPELNAYERDRLAYGPAIRKIHESGKHKVQRGWILQFGDSLTGAHLYRTATESALGLFTVEARGRAGWKTSQGREIIDSDLMQIRPEFCLILYGTNNRKDSEIDEAMQDLLDIAQSCASSGAVPIIATIPPSFKKRSWGSEEDFNQGIRHLGQKHHIPIAYLYEEIQAQSDPRSFFARDGVHWHKKAFPLTGRVWKQAMDQVLFALLDRPD